MKKLMTMLALLLFAFANPANVKAQDGSSRQEIAALVSELSWESVRSEEKGLVMRFYPNGEAASKLAKIGKPATDELLKVLSDETKGVAAHIILTQIWEGVELGEYGESAEGDPYKLKSLVVTYTHNGLKWTWNPKKGYKVARADLAEIAKRWRQKLDEIKGPSVPDAAPNNGMHPTADTTALM